MNAEPELSELLSRGLRRGLNASEVERLCVLLVRDAHAGIDAASVAGLELALRELSRAERDVSLPADFLQRVASRLDASAVRDVRPDGTDQPDATILRFARRIVADAAIARRIQQAASREARLEVCVQAGAGEGFRFSRADLEGLLAQAEPANDGALTDEQLEAVAGGATPELAFLVRLLKD